MVDVRRSDRGVALRERALTSSPDRNDLDVAPPFRGGPVARTLVLDRSSTGFDGVGMVPRGLPRGPRYQLRVVRGEVVDPPILVWTRHRSLLLARLSKRMEEATPRFGTARLVLWDTRTGSIVE